MDLNNLDLGAIRKLQSELTKLAEQREKQEAAKLENENEKLLSDLRNQKEQLAKEIRELDGNCRAEEARYKDAMANLEKLNSLLRDKRLEMRRLDKDLKEWENKVQSGSSLATSSIQSGISTRQIMESIHPVGAEPAHSSNVDRSIPPSQLLRPLQMSSSIGTTSAFHTYVEPTAISQQVAVSAEKLRIALQNVASSSSSSQPFKPGRQIKVATKRIKSVGGPSSSSSNQLSQLNQNVSGNIRTDSMEFAPDDVENGTGFDEEDGIIPVFGQLVQLGPSLFMCTRCHLKSSKRSNMTRHFPFEGISICMEYDIESMGRAHFKGRGRKQKRKKAMDGVDGDEEIEAKRGAPSSSTSQQPIERPIPIFPADDKANQAASTSHSMSSFVLPTIVPPTFFLPDEKATEIEPTEIEQKERTPVQMDIKIVANEEAPTRPTSPKGSNVPVDEENNENAKPEEMVGGIGGNLDGQKGNNEPSLVIVDNEVNEPMDGNSGDGKSEKMAKFEKALKEIEEKKGTIKKTFGGHYEI